MQWTNQKEKKEPENLLCAVEGSSPGVDADALLPHPRRGGRVPGQNVDAGALGVSPATRRVREYGRRRCSRLDGHVGVDVVTAVDHGGDDGARVSYAWMGCRFHATPVRRRVGDYGRRPTS